MIIYKIADALREKSNLINQKNKVKNYRDSYVKKFVHITIIVFIFIFLFVFSTLKVEAAETYIYFDLSAGNVTINGSTYTGYIYNNVDGTLTNQKVTGTHTDDNKYYIYQSNSGDVNQSYDENGVPIYNRVSFNDQLWSDFITNNTSISSVVSNWTSAATNVGRKVTANRIEIKGSLNYDVTVDNIWSSFQNSSTSRSTSGISFVPSSGGTLKLRVKGDNRIGAIHYMTGKNYNADSFIIENGDSTDNPGSITVASFDGKSNHYNSVIGGCDSSDSYQTPLTINGGIIYAGAQAADNCTGIGGGGNAKGIIIINGGKVTSVVNSSGAAIGGGIGESSTGGDADIKINGGEVFAYNFGYVSNLSGTKYFIPGAAIGGGSSCKNTGNKSTVIDITGGYVYAQSMGGAAIGGGSSTQSSGGPATISIGGNAIVEAQSIGGTDTNGKTVQPGISVGGGTAGASGSANGGSITLNINGGTLYTGSIGGGNCANTKGKIGSGTVTITDGTIRGQVIMGKGSVDKNYFTMTGGIIDNKLTPTINSNYNFEMIEENGGAVFLEYGNATVSGGTIQNCSSENGGAIYVNGGDFELSETGKIKDCNATNGGAVFVSGGNVYINGGTITDCNATNGGAVGVSGGSAYINGGIITSSKATNGGAIGVSGGNLTLSNGTITTSEATTGGAIYVAGGNMDITGGTIANSKATNGGGVYITNGNINMSGGNISNNQAEENGGGIYAYSDTTDLSITVSSGSIIGNIAGINGGGIGINMGSGLNGTVTIGLEQCKGIDDTHSHPIIKDNISNKYGGGFWLNGDSMTMNMYCGNVNENIAILESGSSNIYQTGGNATVYAGTVGGGVIVVGGEYIYFPENQMPEITIIYDSNNSDIPMQTIAYVTNGVEVYLPKNVFTKTGYVLYGWSTEPNPATDDDVLISGMPYQVDEEIVLYAVWKKEGSGHIKTPVIKSGRHYSEITGGTNIMISQDSSFTAQMTLLQTDASFYANRVLIFDKSLINGTKITMVDCTNKTNIQYYNYEVINDTTNTISLTEFTRNGTSVKFKNSSNTNIVDEIFLFIVELPKNNTTTGAMSLTLKREPQSTDVAAVEQVVTFTTTEKRNIEFTYNLEKGNNNIASVDDTINFNYQIVNFTDEDSNYADRKMALVVKAENNEKLPAESKIYDGTNYYFANSSGNIVVPFGNVSNNGQMNINLSSKTLNITGINLKAELWISSNKDAENPCMGELVGEISNIKLEKPDVPSIKSTINKKIYNEDNFFGELDINYETIKLDNYDVIVELQKKNNENIYESINENLKSVNGNDTKTNGEIKLSLKDSGTLNIDVSEELKTQSGSYRILLKVFDGNNKIYELPNNFIIEN